VFSGKKALTLIIFYLIEHNWITVLSLREVDIIVVGLGPAGSAFSYFTSKSSVDIICFERNTKLALKPCGELVPKELFSIIGVNPREVNAYPIRRVIVYFYHNGSLVERVIEFNGVEGYSISKRRLLEILVDKALSSGVSVELGKPVLRISRDGVVNVREVGIVRGKYVICCDGVYGVSVEYFKPGRVAKAYQRRGKGSRLSELYYRVLNEQWEDGKDRLLMILFSLAKKLNLNVEQFEQDVKDWLQKQPWDSERQRKKREATFDWLLRVYDKKEYSYKWAIKQFLEAEDIEDKAKEKFMKILEDLKIKEWFIK